MAYVGELTIKARMDDKAFKKGLSDINSQLGKLKLSKFDEITKKLTEATSQLNSFVDKITAFNSMSVNTSRLDTINKSAKNIKTSMDAANNSIKKVSDSIKALNVSNLNSVTNSTNSAANRTSQRENSNNLNSIGLPTNTTTSDNDINNSFQQSFTNQRNALAGLKSIIPQFATLYTQLTSLQRNFSVTTVVGMTGTVRGVINSLTQLRDSSVYVSTFFNEIIAFVTSGVGLTSIALLGFVTLFDKLKQGIKNKFAEIKESVNTGLTNLINSVKKAYSKFRTVMLAFGVDLSLIGIVNIFKDATNEAVKFEAAMTGLNSILKNTGLNVGQAGTFLKEFTKDGLVTMSDAILTYKNLALYGWNTEQIENVMNTLKDTATFGRQGNLTIGAALRTASEGIKNDLSIKVDNAGVTRNLSQMWSDYAKEIGKGAKSLTDAEKRQAVYNGIMKESIPMMGDAKRASETFSGTISRLTSNFDALKRSTGNFIAYFIKPIADELANLTLKLSYTVENLRNGLNMIFRNIGLEEIKIVDFKSDIEETEQLEAALESMGKAGEEAAKKDETDFDTLNKLKTTEKENENTPQKENIRPDFKDTEKETESWLTRLNKSISNFFKSLNLNFKPLKDAFGELGKQLGIAGENGGKSFKWFSEKILGPFVKWLVEKGLPVFVRLSAAIVNISNVVAKIFGPIFAVLWENVLGPLFSKLGDIALVVVDLLAIGLNKLAAWAEENPALFAAITTTAIILGGAFIGLISIVGALVKLFLTFKTISFILSLFSGLTGGAAGLTGGLGLLQGIATKVLSVIGGIGPALLKCGAVILKFIPWVLAAVAAFFAFKKIGEVLATFVLKTLPSLIDKIKIKIEDLKQAVFLKLFDLFNAIPDKAREAVNGIKNAFNGVVNWFKGIVDNITALFSKLSPSNIIDNLSTKAGEFVSKGISFFSPKSNTSVPVTDYSNKFKVPKAANGIVIPPRKDFLVNYGDQRQGTNIETPESLMREIFESALDRKLNALINRPVQVQNSVLVELDGDSIYSNQRNKKTQYGKNMLGR